MSRAERLLEAVAAIDAANARDPNRIVYAGEERPKEIVHAELMTEWVERLQVAPSEAQLLAARAHHLRRWELPRDAYPEGRAGYLQWRTAAKRQHAEWVGDILEAVGYESDVVERVGQIIRKEGLGTDPQVQVHEDALCLVFLQLQLADVAPALGNDKTVAVLAKTLAKMSEHGRREALNLDLDPADRILVERALGSTT